MMDTDFQSGSVILLVEADALSAEAEAGKLRKHGFSVRTACSGEMAIAVVRETPVIDLVLMSINLGNGTDGVDAAEMILQERDIPLLFLFAHMESEIVAKAERIMAYGYVAKGSAEAALVASIRTALRLHATHHAVEGRERPWIESADRSQLFEAIIERSQEAIAISDPSGRLVYINPAHEKLFGRTLHEVRQMNYRDFYPPESVATLNDKVASTLAQGGSWEGELDVLDSSGRRFPLWERAGSVHDAQGHMLYGFGFMHDVSDRKEAENALRESEYKYRTLFEQALSPILIVDPQGRYIDANPAAVEFLECELSVLRSKRVWDFAPPGMLVEQQHAHAPFMERRTLETDYWVHDQLKTLLLNVVPVCLADQTILYGIGQDITERKRIEQVLRKSESVLRALVEGTNDIVALQDPEGRYLYYNAAPQYNLLAEDVVGKTPYDLFDTDIAAQYVKRVKQVVMTGQPLMVEDSMSWQDRALWISTYLYPVMDHQGHIIAVGLIARDITGRKQIEEALRESNATKDMLLRELQHRVKNTLIIIKSLVGLQAENATDQGIKEALGILENRVRAVTDLYALLYQSESVSEVNLDTYIARMVMQLQVLGGNVQVEYRGIPVMIPVKTAVSLGLILNELITNALKYAFPNQRQGYIGIRLREEEKMLELVVHDNGIGLPLAFDLEKSAGLGLKLVTMLAQEHGGSVHIIKEDKTCFSIKIPKATQ